MIIIIEGIDRVGKTTLVHELSERFSIPVLKQERIGGNEETSVDNAIINYRRALDMVEKWNSNLFTDNIIMDRFHWTEAVYSLVDRNDKSQYYRMSEVEREMDRDKYFVILVMPVNLSLCSREHGKSLLRHQHEFNYIYMQSDLDKYRCSYYSFNMAIKEVERRLSKDGQTK